MFWFAHGSCVHNVLSALQGRVGLVVPTPTTMGLELLVERAQVLSRSLGTVEPWSFERVISSYSGLKARRYSQAYEDIKRGAPTPSTVKMFVKCENICFKPSKVNPACRAIQFRDYGFALKLAKFIKPIEARLCGHVNAQGFPKTKFVAKGLTSQKRAKLHLLKAAAIPGCYMYELDASRFDAHVSAEVLDIEFSIYKRMCSSDAELATLLGGMIKNKGRAKTPHGAVTYSMRGGRMSGDSNTGCGNTIIMSLMLSAFGLAHCGRFDFLDDGDDSVFYSDVRVSEEQIQTFFCQFGFKMSIDNVTQDPHQVSFCQCKTILLSTGPSMIRDPVRAMTRSLTNVKLENPLLRPKLVKTIGMCELSVNRGVPILDSFYRMLIRSAEAVMSKRGIKDGGILRGFVEYRWEREQIEFSLRKVEITASARDTFDTAFGFSPAHQRYIESMFDRLELPILAPQLEGTPLDVASWVYDWRQEERI